MKYLSLFSGIGGFELGIQQAYESILNRYKTPKEQQKSDKDIRGGDVYARSELLEGTSTCIGYSEIDKYAIQIYEKHFPTHKNYGDIKLIRPEELPDFDLLVGGFPCQAFSIAGKRGGFSDTRGTLFFEIARIIKQKQPRLLLLENVKGLLNHDNGRTFQTILATLDELRYDLQWQVLNSKNFGVPQNRERVFIIGHLRGTSRPKVFPFRGTNQEDTRVVGEDVAYTIDANYAKGANTLEKSRRSIVQVNNPKHSNDRIYSEQVLAPTLNTMQGGRRQPKVMRQPLKFLERNQKNIKGDYAFTVDSLNTGGVKVDTKIRRLTPKECERLQGFPDNWTEGISDTQRYKCLGNAVTVNVIKAICKKLLTF